MPALQSVIPKLPSTNLEATFNFYSKLGFKKVGGDYPDYLMIARDSIELHFFLFTDLVPSENYGMCYIRVTEIEKLYEELKKVTEVRPLHHQPWKQKEFSLVDTDTNLLTFGEGI